MKYGPGTKHTTRRFGDVVVLQYDNRSSILVQFVNTGHQKVVNYSAMVSGSIRDEMSPTVCNTGFIGVGDYKASPTSANYKAYYTWYNMIARCYDDRLRSLYPTYADVTVCDEWKNYQVFAEWFYANHPESDGEYHLDKDALSESVKQYGPDTCVFVPAGINSQMAKGTLDTIWVFRDPFGQEHSVDQLNVFADNNNLSASQLSGLHLGRIQNHLGWTFVRKYKL